MFGSHLVGAAPESGALVAILVASPFTSATAQRNSSALRDSITQSGGRVIVTLRSRLGGAALRARGAPMISNQEIDRVSTRLHNNLAVREVARAPFIGMMVATVSPDQVAGLLADSSVVAVEPDRLWAPSDLGGPLNQTDPWSAYAKPMTRAHADSMLYGVAQVTAPQAWALGYKGDGVKVAVLDSGGDATHPDLNFAGGYDAVNANSVNWSDDVFSCLGHGTHVAGTIAAKDDGIGIVGVAPHVQLYAIKVLQDIGGSCLAYTSSEITGIDWAVSQGIRLVNMSLGGTYSSALDAALQYAASSGTYIIAAAGNNGTSVSFPGSSLYTIGVGAVDQTNTVQSWSNPGPEVDVAAPGSWIYSTMPAVYGNLYGYKSGTSMATPHALGVAALILQAFPSLTFDQLRQKMIAGALDIATPGFDNGSGYGLVRAYNSITGSAAPVPLVMAVSPASRNVSAQQGAAAAGDNATVTLTGDNSSSTGWTATRKKSWTTLTTASGMGSGTVAWSRSTAGLAVGTYVDTITVTAAGAGGSPTSVIDTLRITAAPVPLVLAVSPASRNVSAQQGGAAASDNASVTLTGTNSSTTSWTATKKKSWTTLTTASGTGTGTVAWSRSTAGLAVGTYVDTITVAAAGAGGSPTSVIDTLRITAAPVPLVMAVTPASRNVSAQTGAAAAGDNATVTLTGDNSSTTGWTASKKKSWTTLTTGSGTGSGTVAWSRSTAGLAVGTYVDTISVVAAGASGSPTSVIDTLRITAVPVPLVLAVTPASRNVSAQQGTAAPNDNAAVTLTGDNSTTTAWSASKKKSWTTLTTASGTGSGTVAWSRSTAGLAVGTYVDTITVAAAGAGSSPTSVIDTLRITATAVPLALGVSPGARSVSVQVGTSAPPSNVLVTLTGDNAGASSWSATKKKSWTTLTSGSGVGNGSLDWSRNSSGLVVGTYVDTLTVTAPGALNSPLTVFDTLKITAAPVPLVLAVNPASRSASAQQGATAPGDNATVTLTGDNSGTTSWTATKRKSWTTLSTAGGTGSGTVSWTRNTAARAVGTYVDTITVVAIGASGSATSIIDTLRITASATPLVLSVGTGSRSVSVQAGTSAPPSNVPVFLSGDNAASAPWTASKRQPWTTLTSPAGTGNGSADWSRNAAGLVVGIYVDTITITAPGAVNSPLMVFDSMRIVATPVPLTLAVAPGSRSTSVPQGAVASSDNAAVTLSGTNASATNWTATRRKSWTTLTTGSGTGSGTLSWSRSTIGLAAGTYVDTITVTASGALASPAMVIDTLRITALPVPLMIALAPSSRHAAVEQGSAAPADVATITLTGTNAASTTWTASKRKSWTTLTSSNGSGNGSVRWNRNSAGLVPGVYVDTITVIAAGASGSPASVIDSLTVTAVPPKQIAVSPHGKKSRVLTSSSGFASLAMPAVDSALVEGDEDSVGDEWVASTSSLRLKVTTDSGAMNTFIVWQRLSVDLTLGVHVDTLLLHLSRDPSVQATFVDSIEVVSVAQPDPQVAIEDLINHGSLTADQRVVLDRAGNNNGVYDLGDFLALGGSCPASPQRRSRLAPAGIEPREAATAPIPRRRTSDRVVPPVKSASTRRSAWRHW